ncbi:hypothetical protein PybrP1_011871 [[Pythium] brassicae (nom. inval.)]|nr:hypothetical protein PybrP1_011871 [[Pythium] brassicae (nom. inval.)]
MKKRSHHDAAADTPSCCYVELRDKTDELAKADSLGLIIRASESGSASVVSLWTAETVAIPVTYIYTGLLYSLPAAFIEFFPRSLGATDAQLSTVAVVRSLPWTFKVLFGALPDGAPVAGLRFKPYLLLGCLTSSLFHLLLSVYSDVLSVATFSLLLLGAMVGIVMADVMSDALVANRVLRKLELFPGHIQSVVYMCRFVSEMVGFWSGALMSNSAQWGVGLSMRQLFGLLAVLPLLTVVPCIWIMHEPRVASVKPVRAQLQQLGIMLQRRATWQPVSFLVFFNAFLLHNSAWGNYLKVAFHFDAFQYGALSAIGASVTFVAILLYRQCVMKSVENSWQWLYFITGIVVALFSLLNVLLVLGVTDALGIAPFWFAVGDVAVVAFAKGFQYLPLAVIFVSVCPENQEGVAFALLTSMTNVAQAFANTVSNMLLPIWPVELPDLQRGRFDGVWKLTVLTAAISLVPLLFVSRMMPRGKHELERMRDDLSPFAARAVASAYVFGVVWVVVLSLLAVAKPCSVFVGGRGC